MHQGDKRAAVGVFFDPRNLPGDSNLGTLQVDKAELTLRASSPVVGRDPAVGVPPAAALLGVEQSPGDRALSELGGDHPGQLPHRGAGGSISLERHQYRPCMPDSEKSDAALMPIPLFDLIVEVGIRSP